MLQERPCTRCLKRNIGHLCHDEPRDPDSKKAKSSHAPSAVDDSETTQSELARRSIDQSAVGSMGPPPPFDRKASAFGAAVLGQGNPLHIVSPVSGMPGNGSNMNQCRSLPPRYPSRLLRLGAALALPRFSCLFLLRTPASQEESSKTMRRVGTTQS